MNPLIIYRAWDKRNKKFLDKKKTEFAVLSNGKLIVSRSEWYYEFQNTNPEDYKVNQYTGLNDKNGIGIYDGDIVAYSLDGNFYEDEVVWENFGWVLRSLQIDSSFPLNAGLEYEVIGNIYKKK